MGKIRAYGEILKVVPGINEEERKEVMRRLNKGMNLRNAHAHGELITKGEEVYLRFYRNGMQEQLLDNDYWEEAEETLNGLLPRLQRMNTVLEDYLKVQSSEKEESA